MNSMYVALLHAAIAVVLIVVAFRSHERFWSLGFVGWRKVYAGLSLYLIGALLNVWLSLSATVTDLPAGLIAGLGLFLSVAGIGLVLAGSIERLHDLAAERQRLEDVRAGFDLFDTLREVIGGPYSFLEILEYSLKEIVRGANVESGGLWLHNPAEKEWVLTGVAGMSQSFRQQVESIRGSGTGFQRLAHLREAHTFKRAEEIRLFFPEWEAEGYRSVIGLPLVTVTPGQSERRLLGVIVLADHLPERFDEERGRRLHAAADYVAAVIAEARLHRELDGQKRRAEESIAALEARLNESQSGLAESQAVTARQLQQWESERADLTKRHGEELEAQRTGAEDSRRRQQTEWEQALTAERGVVEEARALLKQSEERIATLQEQLADRERTWEQQRRTLADDAESKRRAMQGERDSLHGETLKLREHITELQRSHENEIGALTTAIDAERSRFARQLDELQKHMAGREEQMQRQRDDELRRATERETRLRATLDDERRSWEATQHTLTANVEELRRGLGALQESSQQRLAESTQERIRLAETLETERSGARSQIASGRRMLQDIADAVRDDKPLAGALSKLHGLIPGAPALGLWRRLPDARYEFLAVVDTAGLSVSIPDDLQPWAFELQTIPAEGVTTITEDSAWDAILRHAPKTSLESWAPIWGERKSPSWAVCWPWGGTAGAGHNGCVTAFGFAGAAPDRRVIEALHDAIGLIGALAVRFEAPVRMDERPVGAEVQTQAEMARADQSAAADAMLDLHDALIAWAADQTDDALCLELSARDVPQVDRDWLNRTLTAVQRRCRTNGGDAEEEFLVQTESRRGQTMLRLFNVRLRGGHEQPLATSDQHVELPSTGDSDSRTHWLAVDDRAVGIEIAFPAAKDQSPSATAAGTLDVLVLDDDEPMRELLVGMVETLGHRASGAALSATLRPENSAHQPDIVIVNPGPDDPRDDESILGLQSVWRDTPLIVVSDNEDTGAAIDGEAVRILRRPFRLDQLQDCLESLDRSGVPTVGTASESREVTVG